MIRGKFHLDILHISITGEVHVHDLSLIYMTQQRKIL